MHPGPLEILIRIAIGCFSACAAIWTAQRSHEHLTKRDVFSAAVCTIPLWVYLCLVAVAAWYWDLW